MLTVEPQEQTTARYRTVYEAILQRVIAIPGVQAAGAVYLRPLAHGPIGMDNGALLEGQQIERPETWRNNPTLNFQSVTPGYFAAMGITLLQGRPFSERDNDRAPGAAIVSESTARRLWPGRIHSESAYPLPVAEPRTVSFHGKLSWASSLTCDTAG